MKIVENMLATYLGITLLVFLILIICDVASTAKASGLNETVHTYVILNKNNIVQAYTEGVDEYSAYRNVQHGAYNCFVNNNVGIDCDIDVTTIKQTQLRQID